MTAEQTALDNMLREIDEVIRSYSAAGEIVTHWETIVETRCVNHPNLIRQRRYAPDGSNPYLSLGILDAMAADLRYHLGPGRGACG